MYEIRSVYHTPRVCQWQKEKGAIDLGRLVWYSGIVPLRRNVMATHAYLFEREDLINKANKAAIELNNAMILEDKAEDGGGCYEANTDAYGTAIQQMELLQAVLAVSISKMRNLRQTALDKQAQRRYTNRAKQIVTPLTPGD
jgi:hypothetical protein